MDSRKKLERTLAIIKPGAIKHRKTILKQISEAKFKVLQTITVRLSPEQAAEFYRQQLDSKSNLHAAVAALTAGPAQVLLLAKYDAVESWLWLMKHLSPELTRKSIASDEDRVGSPQATLYGSKTAQQAQLDVKFFFPLTYENELHNDTNPVSGFVHQLLMEGLYVLAKERPLEPSKRLAEWLRQHNPNKPKIQSCWMVETTDGEEALDPVDGDLHDPSECSHEDCPITTHGCRFSFPQ